MQKETSYNQILIGDIVASDFRAAEIFKNAGIDFCCGGKKNLDDACQEKTIDPLEIVKQLKELENTPVNQTQNFNEWDLGFLTDYIVQTHHKYVLKSLPDLVIYTKKISSVHGSHHPELIRVADLIDHINIELLKHLQNEEVVLFPAIKEVIKTNSSNAKEIIKSEITRMKGEHEFVGSTMDNIREITNNYLVPEDGCNSYRVAFKLLKQFEDDLHIHVHLENNILYPKALNL